MNKYPTYVFFFFIISKFFCLKLLIVETSVGEICPNPLHVFGIPMTKLFHLFIGNYSFAHNLAIVIFMESGLRDTGDIPKKIC